MTTAATAGSIQSAGHSIQTADAEKHLSIDGGMTVTETISCADGYFATSGGFLADAVDDGDVSSVFVTTSKLSGLASWTVVIRNDNDVRAQGKLKVSCVALTTAAVQDKHSHGFTATDAVKHGPFSKTGASLECGTGQIPYAVGYETSVPVNLRRAWVDAKAGTADLAVEFIDDKATVTYSARCLDAAMTSPRAKDAPAVVATDVAESFAAGEGITEGNIACPSNTVSLTPSFSFEADLGLAFLGSDPRGTQRMFRFANPFDEATDTTIGVTCIGAAPAAADPVQKITINPKATKNSGNSTVKVEVSCVFKCAVTVKLYGRWAGSQVIAVGKATVGAGGTKFVTLKPKSAFWKDWVLKNSAGTVEAVAGSKKATQDITFLAP
ncbi:hypothetical protein [Nocardioides abyssi]|uniref:Uncharacterized protein n=1 Tax=Nocardioides abyssi TaxID=3058370 RepID=A0ABT8EV82_9ACTN|nr:hypothetical protein [Nocardioides abyssi]MDN4162070.1 hypothetical protein [Nocardioides abyssi]